MFANSPDTFASGSAAPLDAGALTRDLHLLGGGWRIAAGAQPPGALLQGSVHTEELRPGLVLYRTAVRDLHSLRTSNLLHPGLKLCMLLQGSSELGYGSRRFALGPQAEHGAAVLVNLAEPDRFVRQWRRGRSERKVTLTLRPEWFGDAGLEDAGIDAFRREHLAVAPWRPSPRALALAGQLASPPPLTAGLQRLWLESRCLDLAGEALGAVSRAEAPAPAPGLDTRGLRRLRALRDFLDSGAADGMGLADIARHAGMSAAHLQRHFPRVAGTTVIDYLRGRRLQAAHDALERGEADVAAAALLAGYRSPANFATAFRRRFGVTPRQVRPSW
jgi:AraC-like DNA-binding protein